MTDQRTRNFTFVLYPDSVRPDWLQVLEGLAVPAFVSPLHDLDVDPVTGDPKKPHYHVVLMFGGKKSVDQVLEMLKPLGVKFVDIVNDLRGITRYICHLDFFDRADKRLYSPSQVISLCGADYDYCTHMPSDRRLCIQQMTEFLMHSDICELWDFFTFCYLNEPDWYYVLCDSDMYLFEKVLKSKRFKLQYGDTK